MGEKGGKNSRVPMMERGKNQAPDGRTLSRACVSFGQAYHSGETGNLV